MRVEPASASGVGDRDGANDVRSERPDDLHREQQASLTLSGGAAPD